MNERIRELADKIWADEYWTKPNTDKLLPAQLNRFAELIVRECIDIVEQDMKLAHIQMIPLTLEKYANGRLKEKIKQHFGVEE